MSDKMTVRNDNGGLTIAGLMASPDAWRVLGDMASAIVQGGREFCPNGLDSVQKVKAVMLVALGMRLDPVAALQHMHIVKGRVGFSVHLYLALATERVPTFRYEILENTPTVCRAKFQRSKDHAPYICEYTIEQAKNAKLIKADSAWETHPADLLLSMVVRRGCRRVVPDALVGMPVRAAYDGEPDEGDGSSYEPTEPSSASVVDDGAAAVAAAAVATVAESPVANQPTAGADGSAKAIFLAECKRRGLSVGGRALGSLVVRLLTTEAGAPAFKSSAELTTHDWRAAYARLMSEPHVAGAVEGQEAPEGMDDPEGMDAPAAVVGDEPPPASEEEEAGRAALASQLADPEYLLSVSRSLEQAWKRAGSCVKEAPAGSGRWWFVNRDILIQCGRVLPDGAAKSVPLYESNNPEWAASPGEIRSLSEAVLGALDTAANRGRPTAGR